MNSGIIQAALGTGFTFLMTALGASVVFMFRGELNDKIQRMFLGFAAGVMIAASVWSLLIPAIETAILPAAITWIPAACGFLCGGLFLLAVDRLLPHLYQTADGNLQTPSAKRTVLLTFAVTLHNIPEGMAVGLTFALAASQPEEAALTASAFALALGIGIQNFPEGAAIALPLRKEGFSRRKAFCCGGLSGLVEPVFGIATTLLARQIKPFMPWLLSFAAGAMIFVVVEELIPEAHLGEHRNSGTIGVMLGFLVMMILDVALG